MIQIPEKYKGLILETIEEALYKIALNMEDLKGGPMTPQRKKLDKKTKGTGSIATQDFSSITQVKY